MTMGCQSLQSFNSDALFYDACNAPITQHLVFWDLTPLCEILSLILTYQNLTFYLRPSLIFAPPIKFSKKLIAPE